jgi:F0F1-type ATP synthase delta subunit
LETTDKDRLETALKQQAGTPITIDYEIDPNIIAGGILRFENELIDGSILGQITRFKQQYQESA